MKKWIKEYGGSILVIVIFSAWIIFLMVRYINMTNQVRELENEVVYYEFVIDMLDDYYDDIVDSEVEKAVLNERVKWLEKAINNPTISHEYVEQMYEDISDYIEVYIRYTGTLSSFDQYMMTNYNDLYNRMLTYDAIFGR